MKNLKILFCLFFLLSIGSTNVWGYISGTTTVTVSGTTITVSPTDGISGAMEDYATGGINSSWGSSPSSKKNLIIEEGVTHVGSYAFEGLNSLTSVEIPSSVTSIGSNAFKGCSAMTEIYYAGSPSAWASIDFRGDVTTTHPFGAKTNKTYGTMYFFGDKTNATTRLVLDPSITEISPFSFVKTSFADGMNIPGTITKIGAYAFYYSSIASASGSQIAINCKTAPTLGTSAFSNISGSTTIYIPTGNSGYTDSGWSRFSTKTAKAVSGTVDGQSWSLDKNGVLTISGSGALTTSFLKADGASQYPYYYFRFLVDKVVITGGITGLSNILQRAQAMRTLEFQQDNISSATTVTPTSYIYDSPITMLFPYTAVENVNPSTWSSYKRQLSNAANIDQSEDNVSLLAALHNNLTEPFNMNLTRTLSNTMYNTYCSPIDMSAEEVADLFGEGTHLVELDAENTGMNKDDELVIAFKDAAEITAGTPYLIQPANNVVNPSFTNVDPSKVAAEEGVVETEHVDFHGTLNKRTISETEIENQSVIFLTGTIVDGKQQLTWANGGTLKGMRAYWKVKEGTPASVMAKRPVLQIGNGENTTTDLGQVPSDKTQCTKVLRDGQIYILRGEKAYNLQGIEINRPNKL